MEIKSEETTSGFFMGLSGAPEWAASKSKAVTEWISAKILDVWGLFKAIKSGGSGIFEKIKSGWNALTGWFKDDPVKATLAVGGGLILGGVVILSGSAVIGLLGGGIAGILKLGGVLSVVGGINASLGNPIGRGLRFLIRGTQYIYNFNWNVTDSDIRRQQEQIFNNLIINSAGALGQALGALTCGATAGLATVTINTSLLADIFVLIDEDTQDEILDAFTQLIWFTKFAAAQMMFLEVYRNARKWVKANVRTGVKSIDDMIAAWGEEGTKPWSFASAVQEKIENIENETLQEAVEEFMEEYGDACLEALYEVT